MVSIFQSVNNINESREEEQSSSSLVSRKMFSDQEDLQSHLRSALLCQPGDYPAIKLEVTDEETGDILALDLQPRSVHTEEDEASLICQYCSKTFRNKNSKRVHVYKYHSSKSS